MHSARFLVRCMLEPRSTDSLGTQHCAKVESNTNRMTFEYAHNMMILKVHHQCLVTEQFIQGNIPLKHLLHEIKINSEGFLYPIAIPLTCLKWDWMNGSLAILLTFFDFEPILFSKSLFSEQYYLAAIGSSRFLSKLSLMQKLWFIPIHYIHIYYIKSTKFTYLERRKSWYYSKRFI